MEQFEREGATAPDPRTICPEEPDDQSDESGEAAAGRSGEEAVEAGQRTLSAEEAIARLRARIDRLGPVNMMAIEQFDELETRHAFLTTQRKDLVDSIAQTTQAIKRIDEHPRQNWNGGEEKPPTTSMRIRLQRPAQLLQEKQPAWHGRHPT